MRIMECIMVQAIEAGTFIESGLHQSCANHVDRFRETSYVSQQDESTRHFNGTSTIRKVGIHSQPGIAYGWPNTPRGGIKRPKKELGIVQHHVMIPKKDPIANGSLRGKDQACHFH